MAAYPCWWGRISAILQISLLLEDHLQRHGDCRRVSPCGETGVSRGVWVAKLSTDWKSFGGDGGGANAKLQFANRRGVNQIGQRSSSTYGAFVNNCVCCISLPFTCTTINFSAKVCLRDKRFVVVVFIFFTLKGTNFFISSINFLNPKMCLVFQIPR